MKYSDLWSQIQTLEPRQKAAATHKLAHEILLDLKNETLDLQDFDAVLQILNKAETYSGNNGRYSRDRNMLVRYRLKALGLSEVKIIEKIIGNAAVESGLLGIADLSYAATITERCTGSNELAALMSEGVCLSIDTGGDGLFPVQLRLVEGQEPMLSEKEYKLIESSTDTIEINCPTGEIGAGDLVNLGESSVRIKIQSGRYKACVFVFDNQKGFRAHYFVVSKVSADN